MRAIRNGLNAAGIPVENSKGEWGPGQEEINVRYAEALEMADRHAIIKNACKEIAHGLGKAVTFMAKWDYGMAGSSCHIHQSLWSADAKSPLFFDRKGDHGMSEMMKQFLAGQLEHAREITYFLAPYVNSYKRYMVGTFAPTRAIWSFDNRTAGYRICGAGTKSVRVECRIGGADLNPYLAIAALLAAGLDGIEKKMKLEPAFSGDAYDPAKQLREVPKTLRRSRTQVSNNRLQSQTSQPTRRSRPSADLWRRLSQKPAHVCKRHCHTSPRAGRCVCHRRVCCIRPASWVPLRGAGIAPLRQRPAPCTSFHHTIAPRRHAPRHRAPSRAARQTRFPATLASRLRVRPARVCVE